MIGILAARIRERFHRPVIAFAPGTVGRAARSGRSIPSLHLRDALDLVDKRQPGLVLRFGGHAVGSRAVDPGSPTSRGSERRSTPRCGSC